MSLTPIHPNRSVGDGLRPAPVSLTDRLIAREPSESRLSGPLRHGQLVAAQTQGRIDGADRARHQRAGRRRHGDRRRQPVPGRRGGRRDRGRARVPRRQGRRRAAHAGGRAVTSGGQRARGRPRQGPRGAPPRRVARRPDPARRRRGRPVAERHRGRDHHTVGHRPRGGHRGTDPRRLPVQRLPQRQDRTEGQGPARDHRADGRHEGEDQSRARESTRRQRTGHGDRDSGRDRTRSGQHSPISSLPRRIRQARKGFGRSRRS